MIYGIDYASVDGNRIDPVATGARFAYIRASGGMQTDPTWAHDRHDWAGDGIPAGAYHALAWHLDAVAQARVFIAAAGERREGEMPFALDIEADSAARLGMTPAECLAHAEECLRELVNHYGSIVVYTSARVWSDVMGDLPSALFSTCPLWLKVPYAWRERRPVRLDSAPKSWSVPPPWGPSSAGTWMIQFQGDALGLPGTTSTVDLNVFLPRSSIGVYHGPDAVKAAQVSAGLVADGVVGPKTFAALYR